MKKKLFSALLAAATVTSLLVGCGNSTASSESVSPETTPADGTAASADEGAKETIVWGGWSGEEEATKDIFKKMMDTYTSQTGNTVNWVGWTWADTAQQLLIRTQGNEQLDVAQVDIGIFNTLAEAGVLADTTDILGADYLSNIEEADLKVGNIDGKQLAVPWSMAAITMVYNPEILKSAGWDQPPVTMEEFEKCLGDIKAMDSSIIPYAVSTKDATCAGDFMPWLWTFGGSLYDEDGKNVTVDSDAAVQCVSWYQDMKDKGYIAMDTGRGEARQMFAQGKVAFYDDAVVAKGQAVSNGIQPDQVTNVCSAMKRPVLKDGDDPQSTMWGHMLVIFNNSEHKEAAGELVKTLLSDDVALDYFNNNGMPPVTKSAGESDTVKQDAYLNGFLDATKTARVDETIHMSNASEVKSVVTEELQYALLGQKTAEQAVKDMDSRLKGLN